MSILEFSCNSLNSEFVLKNHLTLLFERFVYRSRVNTSGFNFLAFKYHIRYVFKIEQKIACEKGKLNVHFDKWEPINDLVSNVNWSFMWRCFVLIWGCVCVCVCVGGGDGLLMWVVREPTRILWWPAVMWGWQWVWSLLCCRLGLGVVWSTLKGWPTWCVCATLGARSVRMRTAISDANVGLCCPYTCWCVCVYVYGVAIPAPQQSK